MAGLLITPREEDFRKMTASTVDDIIKECGISRDEELEIIKRFKWGGGTTRIGDTLWHDLPHEVLTAMQSS